jgi:hypothetical protein
MEETLDNTLRIFFYPATLGWIALSLWVSSILIRFNTIKQVLEDSYEEI